MTQGQKSRVKASHVFERLPTLLLARSLPHLPPSCHSHPSLHSTAPPLSSLFLPPLIPSHIKIGPDTKQARCPSEHSVASARVMSYPKRDVCSALQQIARLFEGTEQNKNPIWVHRKMCYKDWTPQSFTFKASPTR